MSILDAVLTAMEAPKVPPVAPVFTGEGLPSAGQLADWRPTAQQLYRGLANPVNSTQLTEILDQAKLNWKVCEMPVMIQGKTEARPFPHRKALVRCDTGHPIEIVSDRFKVHQNGEIVAGLAGIAQAGEIKITNGGSLDGGAKVFLHGTVGRQFELPTAANGASNHYGGYGDFNGKGQKKGDIVRLDFRMSGGHKPGCPTDLKAMAMRLVCLNGAVVSGSNVSIRVTHRQKFSASHLERIQQMVAGAVEAFKGYETKARQLQSTPFNRDVTRAFVIEAMQPELLRQIADKTSAVSSQMSNRQLLDHILQHASFMDRLERGQVHDDTLEIGRSTKQVLGVVNTQPGADLARGTGWNAYNAVTYYVDHVRGRGEVDSAVESAISGDGAKLKERALELAVDYTQRLATV